MDTPDITIDTLCINHPDKKATVNCKQCGKSICDACSRLLVSLDIDFCSDECMETFLSSYKTKFNKEPILNNDLLDGFEHPIQNGFKLMKHITLNVLKSICLPLALISFIITIMIQYLQPESNETFFSILPFLVILIGAYIIFAIDIFITQNYLGFAKVNFYQLALKRYFSTIVTWILTMILVFIGTLLIIVPGIILGLRLFWADEFALMHNKNPFEAIKASYSLTSGIAGRIFGFQFLEGLLNYLVLIIFFIIIVPFSFLGSLIPIQVFSALYASVIIILLILWYTFFHSSEIVFFYGLKAYKNQTFVSEKLSSENKEKLISSRENKLPFVIDCPNCGVELELEKSERESKKFNCPNCNRNIDLN